MSIVAVETTMPVANDVILGEFKSYINYGLPTQTLIGATRDGCKVDIERTIKEIAFDGAYGPTLDSDDVPLVRYESLMGKITLNNLYLKYFTKKTISDCEATDSTWVSKDWSGTGGTYAAETTIINSGDQSAHCTMLAATPLEGIKDVFASSKDLTIFDNAEVSDTADAIGWAIYITTQDLTDLGTADIRFTLHCDANLTEDNLYYYDVAVSDLTADTWTTFKKLKSSFTETGTGDWSTITGISFKCDASTADVTEFYVDSIDLIQTHSDSSPIGINGSGFDYTNETTYKEFTASLEVADADYLENVTLIGQRMDGKTVKIVLKNALNDGNISLALEDKDEVVQETQYTGHYKYGSGLVCPIELYEYV